MQHHPDEDELIALALGALPGRPAELLRHLADCPACHSAYGEVSVAVDAVLPAAPSVAAPAGFEARVLDRLELGRPTGPGRSSAARGSSPAPGNGQSAPPGQDHASLRRLPGRRRSYRTPLLVAAAAAVGMCLGGVGVAVLGHDAARSHAAPSDHGASLVTASGAAVGTVEPSRVGDDGVVVMQITAGRPGTHYTCRLLLNDGSTRDAGAWWMPASGRATWIAYGAADTIDRVELVTDDRQVWSSADLDG
ncbi:hypothetical protein [Streptomyces spiralis]|uniref:hypothetical protein n=1 Tax=Streptomyces spiralis TaxID=66376 RepID=UPI0036746B7D